MKTTTNQDLETIAKFMGDKGSLIHIFQDNDFRKHEIKEWELNDFCLFNNITADMAESIRMDYLPYDKDWNYLMKVKEKLNDIGFQLQIPDWKNENEKNNFTCYSLVSRKPNGLALGMNATTDYYNYH